MNNVAVVILNYNGKDLLRKFLPAILEFSGEARIIIADNLSADGSMEMVRQEFPTVEIIQIHANLGFCGGYNFALEKVDSPYYVLLNSDVEVTKDWLVPIINLLDTDRSVAAVQPRILSYGDRSRFEYAGAGGGLIDRLGYPWCRGRIFDSLESDQGQYSDTRRIFWATGACLCIRSQSFHAMKGFDADFFAHMEEIDLCWKLNRAGQQVCYVGQSVVYHVGGGTLSRVNPHKTFLNFRNGLFLIVKNMPPVALLWKLPLRILLDWVAMLAFAAKGSFANAGAVGKAHFYFIGGLRKMIRKRGQFKDLGFAVADDLVYPRSIIFAYFLRGKRTAGRLRD